VDDTTEQLVDYALGFDLAGLSPAVRAAATDRVVDSIACAIVGFGSPSARIAVEAARGITADRPATVLGADHPRAGRLRQHQHGPHL
jgi:2-methylcitrate dehydratase